MSPGHHAHHSHCNHSHSSQPEQDAADSVRRIKWAFALNMIFAFIELIGGLLTGSFAIIADAIHDFGDGLGLGTALIMQKKSGQGPSEALTYGYLRYSVISSLITGVIIIAGSLVIIVEAVAHLKAAQGMPHVMGMVGLAVLGIIVNGLAALGLSSGHSHNEKILSWHLIEDLLGWVAVLIGAIVIHFFQIVWLDPILAIAIALFVLWNVVRNLKEPLRIVLQYVPSEHDLAALRRSICDHAEVVKIDQLHAWSLDGRQHVLSAHIKVRASTSIPKFKSKIRDLIEAKGFRYITLEIDSVPEV